MRHPSVAMAVATFIAALLASAAPAAERKASHARKSGGAGSSTGLLIVGAARDAGATAFSVSRNKCDQDKDDDAGGMRAQDRAKHPRPDCDDDDDDDDDCDQSSGHHHGGHKDKHKDKDRCRISPKKEAETERVIQETTPPRAVNDLTVEGGARRLRAVSHALEAALYVVIGGSALAIGAVHPWAYVPLWLCAGLIGILAGVRAVQIRGLRRVSGRWCPAWPRAPLMWPGVAFLAWAIVQVSPLPAAFVEMLSPGRGHVSTDELHRPHAFTIDAAASLRGLAFVASMLVFHVAAAALAEHSGCRRRFRAFVAWFGASLALIALVQIAVAAPRIYGIFMPLQSETFFGVFVNRDHFAAYMTLCAMAGLAILHRALQSYRYHLGARSNFRRRVVTLGKPEGIHLILAVVPVLMTVGALIATTSRGGILSFVGALVVASVAIRRHQQRFPVGILACLLVLPLAWFGLERLEDRFGRFPADKIGRTAIWRHSVASMSGTWLTGAGLNTFRAAVSRALPLTMPAGAAPWPGEVAQALPAQLRIGYRTPVDLEGWQWYEEAHNDYVQLAVEMGAIGVAIGVWALVILAARMREPWLAAGVVGLLMHATVDFSLQIPAVAVLFFAVCAFAEKTPPASLTPG